MKGKKQAILALTLALFALTGCGGKSIYANYRAVEEMEIIYTLGVDREGDEYILTMSGTAGEGAAGTVVLTQRADTLTAGLQNAALLSRREHLFFAHLENLVIGEAAAQAGIQQVLDFLERNIELRMDVRLYVVQGGTAQAAVAADYGEDYDVTKALEVGARALEHLSTSYPYTILDFTAAHQAGRPALAMALQYQETAGSAALVPQGYGVFSQGALMGYLDSSVSQAATVLLDKFQSGVLEAEFEGVTLGLRVTGAKTRISGVWTGDTLDRVEIQGDFTMNVTEQSGSLNLYDGETLARLEAQLAQSLAEGLRQAIQAAKDLGVDCLEIGSCLERQAPDQIQAIADWDQVFCGLKTEIQATVTVERTYDIGPFPLDQQAQTQEG